MSPRVRPTHPLIALSSAAVIAVYSAGYMKTRAAAAKFSDAPAMHRAAAPVTATMTTAPSPAPAEVATGPIETPAAVPSRSESRAASAKRANHAGREQPEASTSAAAHDDHSTAAEPNIAVATTTGGHDALPVSAERSSLDLSAAVTVAPAPAASVAAASAASAAPATARSPWRDGTYSGWGTSRHGDIQATIVIESGRIMSARISQCLTRYSCSWIAHLPGQVVSRQTADVDYVSGATQSSNAFYSAIVDALSQASR